MSVESEAAAQGAGASQGLRASSRAALAIAAVMTAMALVDTPAFELFGDARAATRDDYLIARRDVAFAGAPMEAVTAELDRRLPPAVPVWLGPGIITDPLKFQRFSEGLYPRRLSSSSVHVLAMDPKAHGAPLAGPVTLLGPPTAPTLVPHHPPQSLEGSPLRALLLTLSLLGFGLAALAGARRLPGVGARIRALPSALVIPAAIAVGALAVALLCSLASWTNLALRWNLVAAGGLAALGGVLVASGVRLRRAGAARARELARTVLGVLSRPEVLVGLAVIGVAAYVVDRLPIVTWDARSIWFFRAKQLFVSGHFLARDASEYSWTHPEYPLLYPAITAFFSSFGQWDERRAAMAIVLFFGVLLSLIFMLARRALGRGAGALFAAVPCVYLFQPALGGYADGFVTLSLLVAVLGFAGDDTEVLGWLGAFSAAAFKREGFILAVFLAIVQTLIGTSSRGRRWSRRALPFLGFVPVLIHGAWVKHLGIPDTYAKAKLPATWVDITGRFEIIWSSIRDLGRTRSPIQLGVAGLILTVVFVRDARRAPSGLAASLTGLAALAFSVFAFLVTPFDLQWHLSTALERLMEHVGLLLAVGGILVGAGAAP
jgi:hypothetical protein